MKGHSKKKVFHIPHGIYSFLYKPSCECKSREGNFVFWENLSLIRLDVYLRLFRALQVFYPIGKLVVAGYGNFSPYLTYINCPQIEIINNMLVMMKLLF